MPKDRLLVTLATFGV